MEGGANTHVLRAHALVTVRGMADGAGVLVNPGSVSRLLGPAEAREQHATSPDSAHHPGIGAYTLLVDLDGPASTRTTGFCLPALASLHHSVDLLLIHIEGHMTVLGAQLGKSVHTVQQTYSNFVAPLVRAFRASRQRAQVVVVMSICDGERQAWQQMLDDAPAGGHFELFLNVRPVLIADIQPFFDAFRRFMSNLSITSQPWFATELAVAGALPLSNLRVARPVFLRARAPPVEWRDLVALSAQFSAHLAAMPQPFDAVAAAAPSAAAAAEAGSLSGLPLPLPSSSLPAAVFLPAAAAAAAAAAVPAAALKQWEAHFRSSKILAYIAGLQPDERAEKLVSGVTAAQLLVGLDALAVEFCPHDRAQRFYSGDLRGSFSKWRRSYWVCSSLLGGSGPRLYEWNPEAALARSAGSVATSSELVDSA